VRRLRRRRYHGADRDRLGSTRAQSVITPRRLPGGSGRCACIGYVRVGCACVRL